MEQKPDRPTGRRLRGTLEARLAWLCAGLASLAFALEYRKAGGTFTDDEIRSLHERAAQVLKEKFGAELR